MKRRVLFVCASNSIHGPMAEALLRQIDSRNFEAMSAGTSFAQVSPIGLEVMKEIGIDLEDKASKRTEELRGEVFDFVITLDESSSKSFSNITALETVRWNFGNPETSGDKEMLLRSFRSIRDQICQRLRLFAIVNVRPGHTERTLFVEGSRSSMIQAS